MVWFPEGTHTLMHTYTFLNYLFILLCLVTLFSGYYGT